MTYQKVKTNDERFWEKIEFVEDCWLWVASKDTGGYGVFFVGKLHGRTKNARAHVYSYELFVGPKPKGMDLDHLCRNRACVNPAHLEPVTRRENVMRGLTVTGVYGAVLQNRQKTHCVNGHMFTTKNTRLEFRRGSWRRRCLACGTESKRRQWTRLRKIKTYKHPTWEKKRNVLYGMD